MAYNGANNNLRVLIIDKTVGAAHIVIVSIAVWAFAYKIVCMLGGVACALSAIVLCANSPIMQNKCSVVLHFLERKRCGSRLLTIGRS